MIRNRVLDGQYAGERISRTHSGLIIETKDEDVPLSSATIQSCKPLAGDDGSYKILVHFKNGLSSTIQVNRAFFTELQSNFFSEQWPSSEAGPHTQKTPHQKTNRFLIAGLLFLSFCLFISAVVLMQDDGAADSETPLPPETETALPDYMDGWTETQIAAHAKGLQYLETMPFSRSGLAKQLEYEGFSPDDALFGASSIQVNWNEEALLAAQNYLNTAAFSKSGLTQQLIYEGFTSDEAAYGASIDADWMEQAVKKASTYLNTSAFSYQGLIDQLIYEGFTEEEAAHGADHCGADWNEQAVQQAKAYQSIQSYSTEDLIDQLEYEGFTYDQALYGATRVN